MHTALDALLIDINQQTCFLLNHNGECIKAYPISTAKAGVGQKINSEQTPLGRHRIVAHAGINAPRNTVFVGRVPQKYLYGPDASKHYPGRKDWILTRVFWLAGLEPGLNLGGDCDSQERMIYIHGTPDTESFASPSSHGCVRMRNDDIVMLSKDVYLGIPVEIVASSSYTSPVQ